MFFISLYKGERGLEICGHGAGPFVPVDIHVGRGRRHGWHHSAGAHPVR